jgi:hypothetical protein
MSASATATPVVTKLNFAEHASRIRLGCGMLDEDEKKIQKEIVRETPAWVAAHVNDDKNCHTIHLEGTRNHPNWTPAVKDAVVKRLAAHRNSAGDKISLSAD